MARTHTFKGSASAGYGYAAFIEEGQLVITEDWGREGGVLYRGSYRDSEKYLNMLCVKAPKLFSSIVEYYSKETKNKEISPYTFTHTFQDSRDSHGYGWYAYIENGKLVIGHEAPREGGVLFRGTYEEAAERGWLATLLREDQRLYHDIDLYFIMHEPRVPIKEKTSSPAGVLWKVKLYMDSQDVHNCLVRGSSQADVIKKLLPDVPEVLTLQAYSSSYRINVFAVRSEKISAVEFMED